MIESWFNRQSIENFNLNKRRGLPIFTYHAIIVCLDDLWSTTPEMSLILEYFCDLKVAIELFMDCNVVSRIKYHSRTWNIFLTFIWARWSALYSHATRSRWHFFSFRWYRRPGESIQPVDPTGNDRIRHRFAPESGEFYIKTDRNRSEFHRIPN